MVTQYGLKNYVHGHLQGQNWPKTFFRPLFWEILKLNMGLGTFLHRAEQGPIQHPWGRYIGKSRDGGSAP